MCFITAVLGVILTCFLYLKCDTPNIAGVNRPYLNRYEASLFHFASLPPLTRFLPSVFPSFLPSFPFFFLCLFVFTSVLPTFRFSLTFVFLSYFLSICLSVCFCLPSAGVYLCDCVCLLRSVYLSFPFFPSFLH